MDNRLQILIFGLIISVVIYGVAMPEIQVYLDGSNLPIWERFAVFEISLLAVFYFIIAILTDRIPSIGGDGWQKTLRYTVGAWAFYHFIDWSEAPWALTVGDIIIKTPAWSLSSDTLGASLFCTCQEAATQLTCNSGCFSLVNAVMPFGFLLIAMIALGPEIASFVKKQAR